MIKLPKNDYLKVLPLIKSHKELSIFSVISGYSEGSIYADEVSNPTSVFIKTSECNYLAGNSTNTSFNKELTNLLDFWDPLTPDTFDWDEVIKVVHPDKYLIKYERFCLIKEVNQMPYPQLDIPDGLILERVDLDNLRFTNYENKEEILDWIENWGNDDNFKSYGLGVYLRKNNQIISWSISDCIYNDTIAIGIHTTEEYRKLGLASIVVKAMQNLCFKKGYHFIEWSCVSKNQGSLHLATNLGFNVKEKYHAFSPYIPIENLHDLNELEWERYAKFFEQASINEPKLLLENIYTYIKANKPDKVKELLKRIDDSEALEQRIKQYIAYLQKHNMALDFK